MTQQECLAKAGMAYGVVEPDGDTVNWYDNWFEAELARYRVIKSAESIAELKAKKVGALDKARAVKAEKKAEIERRKTTTCPTGCGYTIAMCACKGKVEVPA